MRTIVIEQNIYKCSEKVYKLLVKENKECDNDCENEDRLFELIQELKPKFKFIGTVDFHYQT
jgi:hypothetical protein